MAAYTARAWADSGRTYRGNDVAKLTLTAGRVAGFTCDARRAQSFLWDARTPGLALRVTPAGAKSYVFQSRLRDGGSLRLTIGAPTSWSIPAAQAEARRLQSLIDQGFDPRAVRAADVAAHAAERAEAKAERARREVSALDAWATYRDDRASQWGERHRADHERMVQAGGEPRTRSKATTTNPGILRALLDRPLVALDAEAVGDWITRETRRRPTTAALAFRLLRAFLRWCSEHADFRVIVDADACANRSVREKVARPKARNDVLQREQLALWFAEVRKLAPVPSAYLQCLLLTGARREELLGLRWTDVDFRWKSLRIRDKVEGERVIPLTPYVAALLRHLHARNIAPPRRLHQKAADEPQTAERPEPSPWVFASRSAASGRLQEPRIAHNRALAAAGLPHLTLHGLRRSFGTLSEWVECPTGIVAQIMGHKPSALAEKHYRVRPLDLLRLWHERIEGWILAQAGIAQVLPAHDNENGVALRLVG